MRDTHVQSNLAPDPEVRVVSREVIPGISRPKLLFLLAAGLSFLLSVHLFFTGDTQRGIFVGIWVPSILAFGALLLTREGNSDD